MDYTNSFTDHRGDALAIGDRVLPIGWGDGVPLYLANTPATIVGIARTRIRVRFDGISYGGSFADFDAILPGAVRRITGAV